MAEEVTWSEIRPFSRQHLKLLCLPIPPHSHLYKVLTIYLSLSFIDKLPKLSQSGGRSGIRTLEGLSTLPVFLTTIAFATKHCLVCGLDFAFTIALQALGGSRQVSTRF